MWAGHAARMARIAMNIGFLCENQEERDIKEDLDKSGWLLQEFMEITVYFPLYYTDRTENEKLVTLHRGTHRQQDDLISLLLFLNKENVTNISLR
jgi:hypothetical protein